MNLFEYVETNHNHRDDVLSHIIMDAHATTSRDGSSGYACRQRIGLRKRPFKVENVESVTDNL